MIFLFIIGFPFSALIFLDPIYLNPFYHHISYLLASLNSSINPLIYFLVGSCRQHQFQGSAQVALRRVFEEKAVSKERSHVPGDTAVETTLECTAGKEAWSCGAWEAAWGMEARGLQAQTQCSTAQTGSVPLHGLYSPLQ